MANKQFYVVDTTLPKAQSFVAFNDPTALVKHLEGTVQRQFGRNRTRWMQDYSDLGNPGDDDNGISFVSSLGEYFNIGIIHSDGRQMKCNIFESIRNSKYRTETGD